MSRDGGVLSQLEKSALVLDAFPGGSALTLAQVCTRTGLARSTVHRLLVDLATLGWIGRSGNTFELGIGLFELGERVAVKHRLRTAAMPFMQDLYAVTGQTVHLAVRNRFDAVYIEKLSGHIPLPLPSQIGGRLPPYLHCGGQGVTRIRDRGVAHRGPRPTLASLHRELHHRPPRNLPANSTTFAVPELRSNARNLHSADAVSPSQFCWTASQSRPYRCPFRPNSSDLNSSPQPCAREHWP